MGTKELGRTEVYPRGMKHDPSGRFVAVIGDGEYTIYTALAWRNKSFGKGLDFVWGDAPGSYAVRESGGRIRVFSNFKESLAIKPPFTPEGLFGGVLIGVRGTGGALVFYDWEGRLVRRIEVTPRSVIWADNAEYLTITTDAAFYILRYHAAEVVRAFAQQQQVSEEGVESALEVVHEERERIRDGQWVGDCFLYLSAAANRLSYCVGSHVFPVAHLDRRMYFLRYLPRDSRVYLMDKSLSVCAYTLHLAVINYQTAVLRGDAETAAKLLPDVPLDQRTRIAKFLQSQNRLEDALAITTDEDHRFELAIQLARLDVALEIARKSIPADTGVAQLSATPKDSVAEHRWKMLADLAIKRAQFELAEECLLRSDDVAGLLLLYTSTADAAGLAKLAVKAKELGKFNVAFACWFVLRDVQACLDLLCETGRLPEAALMARTYAPSRVSEIVGLWKRELAQSNPKAAEALADPNDFPNLFPDIADALKAEKMVAEEYKVPLSSADYEEFKDFLARNLIQEVRDMKNDEAEINDVKEEEEEVAVGEEEVKENVVNEEEVKEEVGVKEEEIKEEEKKDDEKSE